MEGRCVLGEEARTWLVTPAGLWVLPAALLLCLVLLIPPFLVVESPLGQCQLTQQVDGGEMVPGSTPQKIQKKGKK